MFIPFFPSPKPTVCMRLDMLVWTSDVLKNTKHIKDNGGKEDSWTQETKSDQKSYKANMQTPL